MKINIPLPEFLYEDDEGIKIGLHRDTDVTEEWNTWLESLRKANTIRTPDTSKMNDKELFNHSKNNESHDRKTN